MCNFLKIFLCEMYYVLLLKCLEKHDQNVTQMHKKVMCSVDSWRSNVCLEGGNSFL